MLKGSNLIIAIVVTVVVIGGGFLFLRNDSSTPTSPQESEEVVESEPMTEMTTEEKDTLARTILDSPLTQSVTLEDVTEGTGTGTAYVLRDNGKLYHMVNASLPELEEGVVYEGWLVKKTPELMFVSTGVMQAQDDGVFVILFMSDNQYDGYDDVVITLETVIDETPEEHILEGTIE